jgi:transcriptional regulator with XRE-family HTH domain
MGTQGIISSREIGEKVKFRRQDVGMSQERLAEILGVSYQQVQRYESGRNKISVERVQEIAQALSVPVSYFFEADKTPIISDPALEYVTPSIERKSLLKHFDRIASKSDRQFVINAARLAAGARQDAKSS